MIKIYPVYKLRTMTVREVDLFNEGTKTYNSIDKLLASAIFRFASDHKCPAMFIKYPEIGEELTKGLVWISEFDKPFDKVYSIAEEMKALAIENYGGEFKVVDLHENIVLLAKKDYLNGRWNTYGFEYTGVNGISIPS